MHRSWQVIVKTEKWAGRIFVAKAAILLAMARKCRDADHLTNLVYDTKAVDAAQIAADLDEARRHPEPIPEYAFDCHTREGRRRGKTRRDFFRDEHGAPRPRQRGLFDADVQGL